MEEWEEKAQELMDKGWIKSWMLFEVQAVTKDVLKKAIKNHISKIKKEKGVKIVNEKLSDFNELEASALLKQKGVDKVYSVVAELIVVYKDFEILTNNVINYGPSAVEILGPEKITLRMRDAQNVLASIADMMHKYALAGRGGVIISS